MRPAAGGLDAAGDDVCPLFVGAETLSAVSEALEPLEDRLEDLSASSCVVSTVLLRGEGVCSHGVHLCLQGVNSRPQ